MALAWLSSNNQAQVKKKTVSGIVHFCSGIAHRCSIPFAKPVLALFGSVVSCPDAECGNASAETINYCLILVLLVTRKPSRSISHNPLDSRAQCFIVERSSSFEWLQGISTAGHLMKP